MAQSVSFKKLEVRIGNLRNRFLPANFSQNGMYSEEDLDKARAFRMLAHAELEHFFEERAVDIAEQAFNLLKNKSRVSRPIVHLLSNIEGGSARLPSKLGTQITTLTITGKALAQYKQAVLQNHGIRIANLLGILLPIGILESDLDSAWLSTTDGFGAKRGATAHSSAITNTIDPQDDLNIVTQIMNGLKDVDAILSSIKKKIK